MTLPRLSSRPLGPGQYTSPGAFTQLLTFNTPANPTANIPAAPFVDSWASMRAMAGSELDRAHQLAQRSTHLVTVPYQKGLFESMTITLNDGDSLRTFQIEYIEDPDEQHRELRMMCFEMNQNAGSGVIPQQPAPQFIQGSGAPSALGVNGTVYWDAVSGNLYEQQYFAWVLVGHVSGGGGPTEMPSLIYHKLAAAGTNAAVIKNSSGTVTGWKIYNNGNYPIYVKLFDKASAPTVGTDVPKQTIGVDAGMSDVSVSAGFTYTNGIAIAITKGIADNDAQGVLASDCVVDIFYQ